MAVAWVLASLPGCCPVCAHDLSLVVDVLTEGVIPCPHCVGHRLPIALVPIRADIPVRSNEEPPCLPAT